MNPVEPGLGGGEPGTPCLEPAGLPEGSGGFEEPVLERKAGARLQLPELHPLARPEPHHQRFLRVLERRDGLLLGGLAGEPPKEEAVPPLEHAKEALMMGLRTREGVELGQLEARTGLPLKDRLLEAAAPLREAGWLEARGSRLAPTEAGLDRVHSLVLSLWEALS